MESPVQVTFRDITPSPSLSAHVEKRAAKLDAQYDRIVRCHVVLAAPHRHSHKSQGVHVRIDLHVPGKELVVSKLLDDAFADAHAAIDDAFTDAERVLDEYVEQLHGEIRGHKKPPHGVVTKLFDDRGYGFIEAEDGREVYFHQNSVLGARFGKLAVGTRVRFAEEDGDKGPQASTVHIVGET